MAYDLLGIKFEGHPNLYRIFLWEGYRVGCHARTSSVCPAGWPGLNNSLVSPAAEPRSRWCSDAGSKFAPPALRDHWPQHPSTHGVFRLRVVMDGERILDADMVVGYLHRSMEKLAEERTYTQNIPFTDRMDYLAAMTGNLGYCLAVEACRHPCSDHERNSRLWPAQRLASHCMAVGAFTNDTGARRRPSWTFASARRSDIF
jgi:hypothetical protein